MDEETQFSFHQENHGSFLHIYVPGKLPDYIPMQTIRWQGKPQLPDPAEVECAKHHLKNTLNNKGLLQDLPQRQIPGYSSNYPYDCQFSILPDIVADTRHMTYIRNDVHYHAKHALWFPLLRLLTENRDKFSYILIDLPVIPQITPENFFTNWLASNQKAIRFFQKVHDSSAQTRIHRSETQDAVILSIQNHRFASQPTTRIRINFATNTHPASPLTQDELDELKQRVFSRDAYLLRGLNDQTRKSLAHGMDIPLTRDYQLHWKRWLSLGGQQVKNNALIIPQDMALHYRTAVLLPTEHYLSQHKAELARLHKPVYIDVPVPVADYRNRPITRPHTKHIRRHALNNMVRRSVWDYEYGDN